MNDRYKIMPDGTIFEILPDGSVKRVGHVDEGGVTRIEDEDNKPKKGTITFLYDGPDFVEKKVKIFNYLKHNIL